MDGSKAEDDPRKRESLLDGLAGCAGCAGILLSVGAVSGFAVWLSAVVRGGEVDHAELLDALMSGAVGAVLVGLAYYFRRLLKDVRELQWRVRSLEESAGKTEREGQASD